MKVVILSLIGGLIGVLLGAGVVWGGMNLGSGKIALGPTATPTPIPTPLYKYSVEELDQVPAGKLILDDTDIFRFEIGGLGKKTTGQIHIPPGRWVGKRPVVLMWRGYQDASTYQTGYGTWRVAEQLANAGYITIAPDFLGYGGSDINSSDIWESRFQTYWTAMSLLKSVDQIPNWDEENILMWAHSNGGQIALYLLEATGDDLPTVLWAPVSKGFPYSALVYTDQSDDGGKLIRGELAKFENIYDVDKFSVENYLDIIKAPMLWQQGTADTDVPFWWSDGMVKRLEKLEVEVDYVKYPGADHNLQPSWIAAVARDIQWFGDMVN